MRQFPFPDRITARSELAQDVLYKRIPEADHERICDEAWQFGVEAARSLLANYPNCNIAEIAEKDGLKIVRERIDKVSAGLRFFSEYFPKKNSIHMYLLSIRLFAKHNELTEEEAEELILAHEYFHYLEENQIGITSKRYTIPRISIGPINIGQTGIASLSEIAAHGFARTYWEMLHGSITSQSSRVVNHNTSLNARLKQGKYEADKMLGFLFGKR